MSGNTLGQKIKKARIEKNMTQQDIVGNFITRNMLSKIENDLAKPSIKTIEYLAKQLDKPISYFLESLIEGINENSSFTNGESNKFEIIFEHSSFLVKNNNYDKCIEYLDNFFTTSDNSNSSYYCGRILYNYALCHYKKKQYPLAKKKFEQLIEILIKNIDYYYISNSYYYLERISHLNHHHKNAEDYGLLAIKYLEKSYINDVLFNIKLHSALGFTYKKLEKYSDAIKCLDETLELSKKFNCHYNSGEIHMLLGTIYRKINKIDKAMYHANKAINFFDFIDSHYLKASAQRNLANYYVIMNMFDEAEKYYTVALDYCKESENIKLANTIKSGLLECLVGKGLYTEAIDYFDTIDSTCIKNADFGNNHKFIGKAYFLLKKYSKAKKHLFIAEEILSSVNRFDYLTDTYNILAQLHSTTNEYKEAYEYSAKANEYFEKSIKPNII